MQRPSHVPGESAAELRARAAEAEAEGLVLDAGRLLNQAIALGQVEPATWAQTARLMTRLGEYAQACDAFDRAVRSHGSATAVPADILHDRAQARYRLGHPDEAVADLRAAIDRDDPLQSWVALAAATEAAPCTPSPVLYDIRTTLGAKLADHPATPPAARRRDVAPASDGRLRVGYVSSWFGHRNYMTPVWGVINHHDRTRLRITLLADEPPGEDYRPRADDEVVDTGQLDNAGLAALIDESDLDVVVDLNALSTPQRLGVWANARRPVTVAWFNHHSTSGLAGIDHLVGDGVVAPPGDEAFAIEQLHRLPLCCMAFSVGFEAPPIVDPPVTANGRITFGALATMYKLADPLLDAWAEILQRVPDARLVIANKDLTSPSNRDHLRDRLVDRGIDADRLDFRGRAPYLEFIGNYDDIDVALDSFPYSGGTTTNEALWQGVPVITQLGDRWVTRTSATLLAHAGLGELVARDVEGYVELAVDAAADVDRLQRLRHSMRDLITSGPTGDSAALARALEDTYFETLP